MKSSVFTIVLDDGERGGDGQQRFPSLDLSKSKQYGDEQEESSAPTTPRTPTSLIGSETSSDASLTRRHSANSVSTGWTLVYLIKGNLGPGLFAIPAAFKDAGLIGGSIGIPIMALLSIHCMHMLVKCTEVCKERRGDADMSMDYSQVIETACLTSGSSRMAKHAQFARRVIKVSLFLKEVAFCSVFVLFAGNYARQLVSYFCPEIEWTIRHWTAVMGIAALGMACIKDHHHLHTLSYVASTIKAVSLVVVFVFIFQDLPHVSERPAFSTPVYMLLYYGTVIFAFEGVTQVLPLHDNMRTTRHFRGWTGVLNTGMVLIGCLYFTLGFYGYLKYGERTYPSITMNLPKDIVVGQVVKIGLIVALMINYGNQMHAAVEITETSINKRCESQTKRTWAKIGVRAIVLLSSVIVALMSENLDLLMSLVGALTCTLVCIVFPPALDTITFWCKIGCFRLAKNVTIILMGLAAFATGTVAAVMAFNNYFDEVAQNITD